MNPEDLSHEQWLALPTERRLELYDQMIREADRDREPWLPWWAWIGSGLTLAAIVLAVAAKAGWL